jgi:PAS domain S-box-containing protein
MSIRLKLALTIFVVELAFLVLLVARDIQVISSTHYQHLLKRAEGSANRLSVAMVQQFKSRQIDELEEITSHMLRSSDVLYIVFEDSAGQVLAAASSSEDASTAPWLGETGNDVLTAEAPVQENGVVLGRVRVGYSTASVEAVVGKTLRVDALLSVFGLLVIAAVAYGLGGVLTRSIGRVVRATERIAAGDLDTRVQINSRDEMGRLGRALDSMAFQLKKAFERIQFSEQQYRFLVENAEDAIFALDLHGRFTHVNPKTEEITGYSAGELLRQSVSKMLSSEDWEKAGTQLAELRQGKVVGPITFQIFGKDRRRVVEVNVVPIRREGQMVGVQGIARDVTERQRQSRMKEALFRVSKAAVHADTLEDLAFEALQVIQDFLPIRRSAVFVKDAGSRTMQIVAHRGWKRSELEARTSALELGNSVKTHPSEGNGSFGPWEVGPPFDAAPPTESSASPPDNVALRVEEKVVGNLEINWQEDVEVSEEDLAVLQVLANGLATGIDRMLLEEDTRRMHEEVLRTNARLQETIEKLEKTQQQLVQSEKLSAIGQLVSGVAHELNNPLTGVIGFTELLLEQDLDPSIEADLRRIHHEASRCERIVRSLLTIARQSKLERVLVNVNEILEAVLELRRYHLKVENITLQTDFCPSVPLVLGDPNQLQQVFLNLITNAAQAIVATKRPGTLHVRTSCDADKVLIEVKDDGRGIAAEHIHRIFDPFFTTKEVGEGTGLGLSISYSLVDGHGGRIWVESDEGKGSTFYVELPACRGAERAFAERADAEVMATSDGARILLVDDEEVVLGFMVRLLERDGHQVIAARNAERAIELLKENRFDLVISDVKMPGMSGQQFFEKLRVVQPNLESRLVFMTGDTMNEVTRSFLSRVQCPVLGKPFTADQVRRLILDMFQATAPSV